MLYLKWLYMANPFDQVLGQDSNSGSGNQNNPNIFSKQKSEKITISFNKFAVERTVYLLIILGLLAAIVFQPFQFNKPGGISGAAVSTLTNQAEPKQDSKSVVTQTSITKKETPVEEKKEEKPAEVKNETKLEAVKPVENNTAAVKTDEPETEKPFKTNFDFKIETIDYAKNEDDKPSKMKSVTLFMWNRWKTFDAKLVFFWYDAKSEDVIKNKKRLTTTVRTVKGGSQKVTVDHFDSSFFDPTEDSELVRIDLYDGQNILQTSATDTAR
jgi:hypothetical protein